MAITSVTVYTKCRRNAVSISQPCWAYTEIVTHDIAYYGPIEYPPDDASWITISKTYNNNPYTGEAWTDDEVDDLKAGVQSFGNWWA